MAKKAKKKSAVSRAIGTVKKAATSTARSTRKAVKKMMPGRKAKKNLPGANPNNCPKSAVSTPLLLVAVCGAALTLMRTGVKAPEEQQHDRLI